MPFESDPDLQLILDSALDAVIVMGADGKLRDWNLEATRIFGWERAEVLGQDMAQLIVPSQHRKAHYAGLHRYLKTGEGPLLRKRVEITAVRRSGEEFPIELSISPLHRPEGVLFLGFARDITERKSLETHQATRLREAQLLHRLTSLASDTASLSDALGLCLASVCELLQWPIGVAYLPDNQKFKCAIWHGDVAAFSRLKDITSKMEFSPDVGLPGRVLAQIGPVWISDVRETSWFVRGAAGDLGVRAAFAFPIITSGKIVAILEFFSTAVRPENGHLILAARAMGDQIGRVLERISVQQRQIILMHELNHRAKNMLAVIIGMASQTAKSATSIEDFTAAYLSRLISLSRAYSILTAGSWQEARLSALVTEVVGPHLSQDRSELTFSGDDLLLPPKVALSTGMILHELTTNSAKYGALLNNGHISLNASQAMTDGRYTVVLTWKESGPSPIKASSHRGFGTKLIEATAKNELGGTVERTFEPEGVMYKFTFPPISSG